jgi:hypothetical protein
MPTPGERAGPDATLRPASREDNAAAAHRQRDRVHEQRPHWRPRSSFRRVIISIWQIPLDRVIATLRHRFHWLRRKQDKSVAQSGPRVRYSG